MMRPRERATWLVWSMAALLQFTGSEAIVVDVQPPQLTVLPGQNVSFLCRAPVPLQYCRIEIPNLNPYNLNNNSSDNKVSYFGTGLNNGQCGFTINRVMDEYNGPIKCNLGIPGEPQESSGTMQLIVARTPRQPELILSRGTDALNVYKLNDILSASCTIRDGRPIANITWRLGDDPPNADVLTMPTIVDQNNLFTVTQNLSLTLTAADNGKALQCIGIHPGYANGYSSARRQLDVKYPPLPPTTNPIDLFGYNVGQPGIIKVDIQANPKPQIEWTVRDQHIKEGTTDSSGRIAAEIVKDLGQGVYEANLRIPAITKQDTETQYILTAYNDMGSQEYFVQISTSPEPEGLDLGVGSIIAIVATLLIVILIVFIVIFARVTGRWCFSGGTRVIDYTGGESADHHSVGQDGMPTDGIDNPHHQVSQEYINGNDLQIKKKEEKINTPV